MSPARSLNEFAASTLDLPALLEVLVEFAQSSLGMRAVRELAPLDPDEVSDALARVGEVQLLERAREKIGLGGLTDPAPLLAAAREGPLEEGQVALLRGFLAAVERLQNWLERRAAECPRLGRLGADLPDLSALRERVDAVVDERDCGTTGLRGAGRGAAGKQGCGTPACGARGASWRARWTAS